MTVNFVCELDEDARPTPKGLDYLARVAGPTRRLFDREPREMSSSPLLPEIRPNFAFCERRAEHIAGFKRLFAEMVVRVVPSTHDGRELDFRAFFEAEYERLLKTMHIVSRNRAEAEDIAQEAMARVFERWDTVRGTASPTGYLYMTAFNLHRSALRRASRALRFRPPDPPADDEDVRVATRVDVLQALRALPRKQLEALLLVEWLGMTSDEAGRVLRIDATSVRGRAHRARESLRRELGGSDDG